MRIKAMQKTISALVLALLIALLSGCGLNLNAPGPSQTADTAAPQIEDGGQGGELRLSGTWQTASMTVGDDGSMAPEYYVRFTDSDIIYGHMKDGAFLVDHADKIVRLEEIAAGGLNLQAEASNGVRYSYLTCESDQDVLEFYESWDERDFPESYRGGASLSRCA